MTLNRRQFVSLALLPASLYTARSGWAKEPSYPDRQIRLISPYTPGGGNDNVARIIAAKLTPALGQAVIVMNKPGANTMIGNDLVAKASPDGYSLVMNGNGFVINPNFYKQLPYDTGKDLAEVSFIGFSTIALVCNLDLPVKSVRELIALAKSRPGRLNFATSGYGGPGHFAGVQFNQMADVNINSIPYKGTAQAVTDLMGGQIQLMFTPLSSVPRDKVRVLAVASKTRSPQYPDVPTVAEAGVPGYEAFLWYGVMTTAGTPTAIVQKLNDEIGKVLQQNDVIKALRLMDITPGGQEYSTPEKFTAFVNAELVKSARISKGAGIQPE
jgi:tripartite-type tricarboxylate transporter receptor subunit TctC